MPQLETFSKRAVIATLLAVTGLQVWHNGLPVEPAPEMKVNISAGPQRFTFAVDAGQRQVPLDVQVSEPGGQTLVKVPAGK